MKKLKTIIALASVLLVANCTKEYSDSENPFDTSSVSDSSEVSLKLSTIEGLHQNVFAVRCANPTCHDGSFEPDFRTVQSTYSSLVYHPVTKNDDGENYTYRVYPGKEEESWLVHRVTTSDEVLGRMPLYATPLSNEEVTAIKKWINDGARDASGNLPDLPNLQPTVHGYQIQDGNGIQVDTNRLDGWASPAILATSTAYTIYFYITDDNTSTDDLQNQKIEFSYDRDNWTPFHQVTPVKVWDNITSASFNTSSFQSNTQVFFRYYVEDEKGAGTEMPEDGTPYWYKENFSILVQ